MKSTSFIRTRHFILRQDLKPHFKWVYGVKELEAGGPCVGLGQLGGPSRHPVLRVSLPPARGPASSPFKPQIFACLTSAEMGTTS